MFSLPRLPQTLQSQIPLLGDDAKLSFRSKSSGISRLSEPGSSISINDIYWEQFWRLFDSPSDVFSLITHQDIRLALQNNPHNVVTLLNALSNKLFQLVSDHTFPSTPVTFLSSVPRSTTKEALNCIRVLSRVFPVIFELDSEVFELEVLWKREPLLKDQAELPTSQSQFVIADDEDEEQSIPAAAAPEEPAKTGPSLAEKLLSCSMDLLFCCGFTLPAKLQVDHYKINFTIWEKGVGSTLDLANPQPIDQNKVEVLRFLLVLLSRPIYIPPTIVLTKPSLYTDHVVQKTPRRQALTFLCSLLNTSMNSASSSFNIPYNHLVWKGEDVRASLVGLSLQTLCTLLDYQSDSARDRDLNAEGSDPTPTSKSNIFRYSIAKLHRPSDLEFIFNGILAIFDQQLSSMNNILPGSKKPVSYLQETVVLFWKLIDLNKKFLAFVTDSPRSVDLLVSLLYLALEVKDKPQHHGLSRSLSYILESLSANAALGTKMTSPFRSRVPAKWNIYGTLADFVINSICSIVTTTSGQLNSLYPAFVISLSNFAPYFRNLSVTSATKLIQLLQGFSNPAFLLSDEGHPRLLYFLLEVFNSVIYHNLTENVNVTYGILRSHKLFENLANFTLPSALREIRRVQSQKARPASKESVSAPVSASLEKAQQLESEGIESSSRRSLSRSESISLGLPNDTVLPPLPLDGIMTPPDGDISISDSDRLAPLSEKAKGKRPQQADSMSMSTSVEQLAQAGVGRNGFVPTQEWVTSWQQGLPLDTVLLMIAELLPRVHELQNTSSTTAATQNIINYLCRANLSHVLPSKPKLNPRKFQWSDASLVWLTSLLWGEVYVRGINPYGIWSSTNVRLFHVKHTASQTRQITDTVSHVVGGLGGLLGRGVDSTGNARPRPTR